MLYMISFRSLSFSEKGKCSSFDLSSHKPHSSIVICKTFWISLVSVISSQFPSHNFLKRLDDKSWDGDHTNLIKFIISSIIFQIITGIKLPVDFGLNLVNLTYHTIQDIGDNFVMAGGPSAYTQTSRHRVSCSVASSDPPRLRGNFQSSPLNVFFTQLETQFKINLASTYRLFYWGSCHLQFLASVLSFKLQKL